MLKLTCNACGKTYILNHIHDFSSCECGAELLKSTVDMIDSVENLLTEIHHEISLRSSENLCGNFSAEFKA